MVVLGLLFPALSWLASTVLLVGLCGAALYLSLRPRPSPSPALVDIDDIPVPIFVKDREGRYTHVNRAFEVNGGIGRQEIIGRKVDHFADSEQTSLHEATDREILAQGDDRHYEHRMADGRGEMRDFLTLKSALHDTSGTIIGIVASFIDVTDQNAVKRELQSKQQLYETIVEAANEGIWIIDAAGMTTFVNQRMAAMLGYSVAEFLGRSMYDFMDADAVEEAKNNMARRSAGIDEVHDFRFRHRDSSDRWFIIGTKALYDANGAFSGALGMLTDITDRKRMEQALNAERRAVQEATEAKSAYLANLSHEIRTPMNAIIGMTDLCLETALDPVQSHYLAKIRFAADTLLHLIGDVLDLAKVEAGRLDLDEKPFDLADVIQGVCAMLEHRAVEKGLILKMSLDLDSASRVVGDQFRLSQVLTNLIGNAIKFTEAGYVHVKARTEAAPGGEVKLSVMVADSGVGMTASEQARLFRPFTQASLDTARRFGGTGLGLSISRAIIEAMRGKIWCESVPGTGSTFQFEVLMIQAEADETEPRLSGAVSGAVSAARERLKGLAGKKILLVEDDELNQTVILDFLRDTGIDVNVASDGAAALAQVARGRPDAILMDCQMPTMNGYEATRRLRTNPDWTTIPVLALTASATDEDRRRCIESGMNDFLTKPVHLDALATKLIEWLSPRQLSTPPAAGPTAIRDRESGRTIQGLDVTTGLRFVGGEWSTYEKYLVRFRDERVPRLVEALIEANSKADWGTSERVVHTLKGLARMLGAIELADAAAEVELAIVQGEGGTIETELENLFAAIDRLQESLVDVGGHQSEGPPIDSPAVG